MPITYRSKHRPDPEGDTISALEERQQAPSGIIQLLKTRADEYDFDDDDDDQKKRSGRPCGTIFLKVLLPLAIVIWGVKGGGHLRFDKLDKQTIQKMVQGSSSSSPQQQQPVTKSSSFKRSCPAPFTTPKDEKYMNIDPLWMPSYPSSGTNSPSGQGNLLKPLVDQLTGFNSGYKSYHMSIKGGKLRRCHAGKDPSTGKLFYNPTAVCTTTHPMTPIFPDTQTNAFSTTGVLFVIRNFATAYPAFHNDKAVAYHQATKVADIVEWRQIRDEYMKNQWEEWKRILLDWTTGTLATHHYTKPTFIVFEHLLINPDLGVPELQKISTLLQEEGFPVAPTSEHACIWNRVVPKEQARLKKWMPYSPGYTTEQKAFLQQELTQLIEQVQETVPELAVILKEYRYEIETEIPTDDG